MNHLRAQWRVAQRRVGVYTDIVYERTDDLIEGGITGREFNSLGEVESYIGPILAKELQPTPKIHIDFSYVPGTSSAAWVAQEDVGEMFEVPRGFGRIPKGGIAAFWFSANGYGRHWCEVVVLHEVAHVILQYQGHSDNHGPAFVAEYARLLRRYAGLHFGARVEHVEEGYLE